MLTINKATNLQKYPLHTIEDLFAQLSEGNSLTKLDLRDAYCQLETEEQSEDLLLKMCHKHTRLFCYTRFSFGVASTPTIFQGEMEKNIQTEF